MSAKDAYYHRNLPHYHPIGYPLFITFRLAGSLPMDVLTEIKASEDQSANERYKTEVRYFERYDDWLDQCSSGPHWLQMENIAQIVAKEIQNLNEDRYRLLAYCIMPNHIHLLIESIINEQVVHQGGTAKYPVTDTLRLLKGRTARACNLKLKRTGSFWQHESYDHVVRDEQELEQIILYILNNPVKAGLAKEWKNWSFTYIAPELGRW
ncbi:MAG TPA: transposase [Anaerolineales bacterium]|nr:transposase [Anaerolineales bacterium]